MSYEDAISLREYAKMTGVSEGYIRKLRDNGKISAEGFTKNPSNGRPLIIPKIADEQWGIAFRALKNIKAKDRSEKSQKQVILAPIEKTVIDKPEIPTEINVDEIVDDEGLPIVRAEMSSYDADRVNRVLTAMLNKIKIRQANGELVEKKEVYKELFNFSLEIRAELQNIAERTIDDVMSAKTRNEGYLKLSGEIDKVLEKLSTNEKTVLK